MIQKTLRRSFNFYRLTRGKCRRWPSPCEHTLCRYHLANITPGVHAANVAASAARADSCALDVADRGPQTLEAIGDMLGISRQRAQQIEALALHHLAWAAPVSLGEIFRHAMATRPDGPTWPETLAKQDEQLAKVRGHYNRPTR